MIVTAKSIAKLCADVGVEIVPRTGELAAGQLCAVETLRELYKKHGQDHLVMLLRTFVESRPENAAAMSEDMLMALSEVILANPAWVETGMRWLEVFDEIDLDQIRLEAKQNRPLVFQRSTIIALVLRDLRQAFGNVASLTPQQPRSRAMPIENDLVYGSRKIAKYLEMPLETCKALIKDKHIPTFRMPGTRTDCARKSALNALWAECERQAMPQQAAS
jgi:hypothetical protein